MSIVKNIQRHQLTILAIAIMVVVVLLYWQTFSRLVGMWSISYYQYGWLVYPASLYVLFMQRYELAAIERQTSKLGFLFLILIVLAWLVASVAGIQIVEFISASLLVFSAFWAIAGPMATRNAAFALLLLLAAVPMTEFLVEPLMKITAEISDVLLSLTGVPVLREEQFFYLPGGSFEVADVCSGLKFLLAGVFAGLAFSYVTYTNVYKRLLFIGLVAIAVVITNGVRAFIVMYVASATDMKILGGEDHIVFGTVMFAAVFVALILAGEKYSDPRTKNEDSATAPSAGSAGAVTLAAGILPILILMAGPMLLSTVLSRDAIVINDAPLPFFDGCEEIPNSLTQGEPVFVNADIEKRKNLSCGEYSISIYMATYGVQRQGKELISWENTVWPREWARYADESVTATELNGQKVDVQQTLIRHPQSTKLIRYWYQVGPSVTGSQIKVKILEVLRILTFQSFESSVIVVSVTGASDSTDLQEALDRYTAQVMEWNLQRIEVGEQE
jgi:exosortase A